MVSLCGQGIDLVFDSRGETWAVAGVQPGTFKANKSVFKRQRGVGSGSVVVFLGHPKYMGRCQVPSDVLDQGRQQQ